MENLPQLIKELVAEVDSASATWGVQNRTLLRWNAIVGEEAGEVAKAVTEAMNHKEHHGYIKREHLTDIEKELFQTAAMCLTTIDNIRRKPDIE